MHHNVQTKVKSLNPIKQKILHEVLWKRFRHINSILCWVEEGHETQLL